MICRSKTKFLKNKMIEFKSIISFDCETTGLPKEEHNQTKITELAFIGCELNHEKKCMGLPRVLHKLTLCFNPKKLVGYEATKCTGLNNELLQNLNSFKNEDFEMLKRFTKRLPSPVCIVAHNGNKFDFPILQRELKKINCNFPDDVYCADSLIAFQQIFPKNVPENQTQISQQAQNETTPKHNKTVARNTLKYKPYEIENNARKVLTPEVCRVLFPEEKNAEIFSLMQIIQNNSGSPNSYKLKDIYLFLFKENFPSGHRAENDAQALLKCIFECDGFIQWMNNNAVLLNSIEPLF